jgi:AcrR family transcriptional regulator
MFDYGARHMKRNTQDTKRRILETATGVFGQHGFKAATVREICKLAGTNVAAINYYFGDKEGLYRAVLEDIMATGYDKYPPDTGLDPHATPEERLHAFVRSFLNRILGSDTVSGSEAHRQLMVRELCDPSPALDWLIEEHVRPNKEILISIISDLLGPTVDTKTVGLCALSVIGQCLHYGHAQPIINRVAREYMADIENIEDLAEHITLFSLGGIMKIKNGRNK